MPSAIEDSFTDDHRRCDRLLAEAEGRLAGSDWDAGAAAAQALIVAMERHFELEETLLFPELAAVFRVAANPIEVMLGEHAQMRALLGDLDAGVRAQDRETCLGVLETLHFLVQQHNYKEEAVLYPMADGALPVRGAEIAASLAGA